MAWDGTLTLTTKVTNTGKVDIWEVVQLYIHDRVASRVRPIRELKAFEKVRLVCVCSEFSSAVRLIFTHVHPCLLIFKRSRCLRGLARM